MPESQDTPNAEINNSKETKKLTRKRKRNKALWQRNLRQSRKNLGLAYTTPKGKTVSEKTMKEATCTCHNQCSTKFDHLDRLDNFNRYWHKEKYKAPDISAREVYANQRSMLLTMISEEPCTNTSSSVRSYKRKYYLQKNETKIPVCKPFFESTLSVKPRVIQHLMEKARHSSTPISDLRGHHKPGNTLPEETVEYVRKHIESFPKMESHYCRSSTKREYLAKNLSVAKMHDLYVEKVKGEGKKPVAIHIYRKIFNTEYNLGFHRPKKDQCTKCIKHKTLGPMATSEDHEKQEKHILDKNRAREEKTKDSKKAKENANVITATCDLEKVLQVPYSPAGQLYFLRKLCVYNFTILEHASKNGFSFVWNESEGKRGSNEIGTCLIKYISTIGPKVVHLILFSDSCGGQNRNQFTSRAIVHALQNTQDLEIVDQKFLVPGHTDMEVDSMHAAVERAYEVSTVMIPDDLHNVIRVARKKKPYEIIPLDHTDIMTFKSTGKKFGEVRWTDIRHIRYLKEDPDTIYIKYSFDDQFQSVCLLNKRTRKSKKIESCGKAYDSRLPISTKKKKDLLKACSEGIVPAEHHGFFSNLPSSEEVIDRLPEPDINESSDEESC